MSRWPPFDLDRVYAVWRAACDAGRILMLPARLAHTILQARRRTSIENLPEVKGAALYLSQIKKHADKRTPVDPLDAEELDVGRRQWEQRLAHDWTGEGGLFFALPEGREAIRDNCGRFVICSPQVVNLLPELCYNAGTCPVTFVLSRIGPFNPGGC